QQRGHQPQPTAAGRRIDGEARWQVDGALALLDQPLAHCRNRLVGRQQARDLLVPQQEHYAGLRPTKKSPTSPLVSGGMIFARIAASRRRWTAASVNFMTGRRSGPPLKPFSQPWYFQLARWMKLAPAKLAMSARRAVRAGWMRQ